MQATMFFLSYEQTKSEQKAKAIYNELTRQQIPVFLVSVSFIAQFSIISQGSCFVFSMRLFHVITPTHYRIFTCGADIWKSLRYSCFVGNFGMQFHSEFHRNSTRTTCLFHWAPVVSVSGYSRHVSGGGSFQPRKFHIAPPPPQKLAAYWCEGNSIFGEILLIEFWADVSVMRLPTCGWTYTTPGLTTVYVQLLERSLQHAEAARSFKIDVYIIW